MSRTNTQVEQGKKGFWATALPVNWDALKEIGSEPIPNHLKKWWWCLGGTPLILFSIQVVTGLLLLFYYVPSADGAYQSVDQITHVVPFGWFIRSMHKWSANLMIAAVFLHTLRVFFTGSYRSPRQLTWVAGVFLLGGTLVFGFTGYSLVYEQMSFWGATVATNITEAVPGIGPSLAYLMRGGKEVGANTLTRFFVLHTAILPVAVMGLIAIHILLIRLHGVTELYFDGEVIPEEKKYFKFWPDHISTETIVALVVIYLLVILSLVFPAQLGEPANPNQTPLHIKPEWYFYFSFRMLKLTALKVNVIVTGALLAGLIFWPMIEDFLHSRLRIPRNISIVIGIIGFIIFLGFTLWESFA